jgi:hypothetical protein
MDFPAAAGRGFLVVLGSVYVAVFSAACLIVPARHLIVQVSIGKFIDEDSVTPGVGHRYCLRWKEKDVVDE